MPQYSLGLRHSSRSVGSALHQCLHRSCPGPTTLWDNRALGSGRAGSHCLSLLRRSCSPKTSGAGAGVLGGVPPTNTRKNQNKRRGCAATAHAAERAGGTCRNVYQPHHHTSPDWEHACLSPAAAVLGYPCSVLTSLGVQHPHAGPPRTGGLQTSSHAVPGPTQAPRCRQSPANSAAPGPGPQDRQPDQKKPHAVLLLRTPNHSPTLVPAVPAVLDAPGIAGCC